jgi:AraC-like DNA-binding protein
VNLKFNWSSVLADELHYEYNYLSSLFSSVEGITLEQYIIRQKIEKVKELLFYDELNLSQIANRLDYSSVGHLSAQFKKVTGFTPSEMKKSRDINHNRKPLDSIS